MAWRRSPSAMVVGAALHAYERSDRAGFERAARELSRRADAEQALLDALVHLVALLLDHGWRPHELARASARVAPRSSCTPALAVAGLAAWASREASVPAERLASIEGSGAPLPWPGDRGWLGRTLGGPGAVRLALAGLCHLRRLPPLDPPAGRGAAPRGPARADEKLLGKVRALLAKAESTTFPEEAEALSAKAQELITRHALDAAALAAGAGAAGSDAPEARRVWLDRPYVSGKSLLLQEVAAANGCRAVYVGGLEYSSLVGFPADLDMVEVLFTSLLVQSTRAMVAAGPQHDGRGRSRTRSFRASFMVGFAGRIGERLREATAAATASVGEEVRRAALPVLARRSDAVDAAVEEAFPRIRTSRVGAGNAGGYLAGRVAADRADLTSGALGSTRR